MERHWKKKLLCILAVGAMLASSTTAVMAEQIPQWKQNSTGWWYEHSDASYTQNGWELINQKWYYFDNRGYMKTGWLYTGGKWYLMSSNGDMVTGWKLLNNKWYYLADDGAMVTGSQSIGGVQYEFDSTGAMLDTSSPSSPGDNTVPPSQPQAGSGWKQESGGWSFYQADGTKGIGWIQDGGKWYYIDNASGFMKTGWLNDGGNWYYLGGSGMMQTGWYSDAGTWYYSDANGKMAKDCWLYVGENLFYLHPNGAMATGTVTVGGITHTFGSGGAKENLKRGIDVAYKQGAIDWTAVKNSGQVQFAMIRDGFGRAEANQEDAYFRQNIAGAKAAGIPVGVYHYSYAESVEDAVNEANFCISILRNSGIGPEALNLPVAFDLEDSSVWQKNPSKETMTQMCKAFCDTMSAAGYRAMVYSSKAWFTNRIDYNALANYDMWLAQGNDFTTHENIAMVDMWQYGQDKDRLPGFGAGVVVDRNVLINDSLIR